MKWTDYVHKILKVRFGTESYLFNMKNRVLRILFTKFRGGLLKLEGDVGRYTSIFLWYVHV